MVVKIKRQKNRDSKAYWQYFEYSGDVNTTVAAVLDFLNYSDDLYDIDGNYAPRIRWECSCLQKVCGACAMVINGKPSLACNTFLDKMKGKELVLEPLSKFPVVADLITDRSIIDNNLRQVQLYIGERDENDGGLYELQYTAAKCLKCGLCLEICPNYIKGDNFFGALFANDTFLTHSLSKNRKKELKREYTKHFSSGCSKALSCESICPTGISTLSSIFSMEHSKRK